MTRRLGFARWLLVAAATGCGSDSDDSTRDTTPGGGQTGEETVGCLPIEGATQQLAWSQRSALGFSATEVMGRLGATRETRLTWSDGSTTTLALELERRMGNVEFQDREWRDDGSGRELASSGCNDAVVAPVSLTFSTGDGAFAETWPLELVVEVATEATAFYRFELDALEGDFTPDADSSSFEDVRAFINVTFTADGWSGQLRGQGQRSAGSGSNGSVSSQEFPIASF